MKKQYREVSYDKFALKVESEPLRRPVLDCRECPLLFLESEKKNYLFI